MRKKQVKEWSVKAPWGKIALISWGNPSNPPVLLLHGYMDTAATFFLLMDLLPNEYFYVAFDIPGHGKSDTFPPGLPVTKLDIIEPIRVVVEHLKWKKFTYMSHFMSCVIGLLFHNVYPSYISKMIFLDPIIPLSVYYLIQHKLPYWYQLIYNDYYDNFDRWNSSKPRLLTYDKAISLVVRNRSFTEEQAEVVLSRSLIPMGIDTYKLSWDQRMKKISQPTISEDTLYSIMTKNMPPTLNFDASESLGTTNPKKFANNILQKCEELLPNFYRVTITGGHDVHITNPELLAPHIKEFLKRKEKDLNKIFQKSKL